MQVSVRNIVAKCRNCGADDFEAIGESQPLDKTQGLRPSRVGRHGVRNSGGIAFAQPPANGCDPSGIEIKVS